MRRCELRIGCYFDQAVRSTNRRAEGVAAIVSRQSVQQRTAAVQIDRQGGCVRTAIEGRRRFGGVRTPKLEDVALGERSENAAILPRRRCVTDKKRRGRGAEEGRIFAGGAAQ